MSCTASVLPALDGCAVNPVKGIKNVWVCNQQTLLDAVGGVISDRNLGPLSPTSFMGALTGIKDWANYKIEAVVTPGLPDGYKHTFEILNTSVLTYANKKLLDESNSVVFFIENNQGELLAFGAKYGLWKTKQSRDLNANNGQISITFESREQIEEPFSDYSWTNAD